MKKRFLSIMFLIVVSLLTMTMVNVSAAPIKIKLWFIEPPGTPANDVINNLVETYNSSHPDIQIEPLYVQFTETGAMAEKITLAISAGVGPDILEISGCWLASIGGALPLDRFVERSESIDLSMFYPSQLHRAMLDGQLFGIPNHTDSRLLFYNKQRFQEAGLPRPPSTWNEAYEQSKKLMRTDASGLLTHTGLLAHYGQGWYYTWAATNGVKLINYDWWLPPSEQPSEIEPLFSTPAGVEALQFMADMVDVHGGYGAVSAFDAAISGNTFAAGRTAMMVEGSWNVPNWRKISSLDFDVAPIPVGPHGGRATLSGGFSWQISSASEHPEEAFRVIEYLVGLENNITFCSAGGFIPVRRDALASNVYETDQIMRAFIAEMEYAVPFPSVPFSSAMWNALNVQAKNEVIRGNAAPKEALAAAETAVKAAIAEAMANR